MAVSDGGDGLARALRRTWPGTAHQRCPYHAFCQVKRYATSRPRTQAGVELYGLARTLLSITTLGEADGWVSLFLAWSERWDTFLSERTRVEGGKLVLTRERPVKARSSPVRLIGRDTLLTYLDPALFAGGPLPSTNNRIEGASSRIRGMLRDDRGMSLERRLKAVFWWYCSHSPDPLPAAEVLRVIPTDESIAAVYDRMEGRKRVGGQSPVGATPSCGPSCTTRSRAAWIGTRRVAVTHFMSYKLLFARRAALWCRGRGLWDK